MTNKDTELCISIASNPSNFGTTFHNLGYKTQGLNFFYKAVKVSDLHGAMSGVRALNIKGCSVSMPFKQTVLKYLDDLDSSASQIDAVNTILQIDRKLIGYNTDYSGVLSILEMLRVPPSKKVIIAGMGGVARAIFFAFSKYGYNDLMFKVRDINKAKKSAIEIRATYDFVDWSADEKADILINATPLGMNDNIDGCPFTEQQIRDAELVFDFVVCRENTNLVKQCLKLEIPVVPGHIFSLEQLCHQYKIYTEVDAPRTLFMKKIKNLFPNFELNSISRLETHQGKI